MPNVTVFWREFDAKKGPGKSATLTGSAFDPVEGCAVAIHRFRELLSEKGRALVWDERSEEWQSMWPGDICPGMVVMLPRTAGGYSENLGWTGQSDDKLSDAPLPGRFSDTFDDDADSELAGWVPLESHLADAKTAAVQIAVALQLDDALRTAVVTAAEWHDIGKSHKVWQDALPRSDAETKQPWAKAPFVFVLAGKNSAAFRKSTQHLIESAGLSAQFFREEVKDRIPRQLWTVTGKVRDTRSRKLLSEIKNQGAEDSQAGCAAFCRARVGRNRASATKQHRRWQHGPRISKRTPHGPASPSSSSPAITAKSAPFSTLVAMIDNDVCGVPKEPASLPWAGGTPMDFSCASVGTGGEFSEDGLTFTPASPGWTALVADLLGGWEQRAEEAPPPHALRDAKEPRFLGPFSLAYLESLICVADIQASKNPSDLRHV